MGGIVTDTQDDAITRRDWGTPGVASDGGPNGTGDVDSARHQRLAAADDAALAAGMAEADLVDRIDMVDAVLARALAAVQASDDAEAARWFRMAAALHRGWGRAHEALGQPLVATAYFLAAAFLDHDAVRVVRPDSTDDACRPRRRGAGMKLSPASVTRANCAS